MAVHNGWKIAQRSAILAMRLHKYASLLHPVFCRRHMTIDELVFVGLNGYALALHRDTGEIVWTNDQMKSGYVSLVLDGDRLIASTNGYMYCLNALTGQILWHNPLSGYGTGAPTSVVSVRGQSWHTLIQQAAAAAAAAAAGS
jgi:outer membrane protein assembly factor BamB